MSTAIATPVTTPPAKPTADKLEIARALNVLFDSGDVIEIRAFKGRRCTISGYYNDFGKLSADAARINRQAGAVYITLNQIDRALLARRQNRTEEYASTTTSDDQVTRRRWLPVDIDPKRPADISSSDAEHTAAIEKAREVRGFLVGELGFPEPVAADSGNGAHLLCRIDLPNDDQATGLAQACLDALDLRFSDEVVSVDTAVFNASRIWKLYGSITGKGDSTADRPHRQAKLLNVPDHVEVVPADKLRALAAMAPQPQPADRYRGNGRAGTNGRIDVDTYLREHSIAVLHDEPYRCSRGSGHRWVLERCVWNPEHTDKSAWVIQWDNGAVAAGCAHNSCRGNGWHQLRDAVEPGWRDRRGQKVKENLPPPVDAAEDQRGDQPRDELRFEGITCAELMRTEYEIRFLVDRILVAGQPWVIGGPQKILKTSILIDLALSLSQAGFFLGKFNVPEAVTVGLMTGESGLATIQETIKRISHQAGIDPSGIRNLVICDRVPRFGNLEHDDAVKQFIDDHEIEVLAVDPSYMALDGENQANLAGQGEQLRAVGEICQDRGVTLLSAHHTKKETARLYEPLGLESLTGAGHAEFYRQWCLLSRREAYTPGTGSHRLWMVAGGSAGHSGLWGLDIEEGVYHPDEPRFWQVDILNADETREAAEGQREKDRQDRARKRLDQDKQKVVDVLAKYPAGETAKVLRETAGLNPSRFKPALAELLEDGDALPCEIAKGNRSKPYEAYKLPEG